MKRALLLVSLLCTVAVAAQPDIFYVYSDAHMAGNHFIPSGWMGDYNDIKMSEADTSSPHSGKTSAKFVYDAKGAQGAGWAGVYWQYPVNNWGEKPGGFNLNGYTKLTFWAKSGTKTPIHMGEFKMGGISGTYGDSDTASTGNVEVPSTWTQFTIDLKGKELSQIIGGFCWSASHDDNPDGFTLLVDDIRYEK